MDTQPWISLRPRYPHLFSACVLYYRTILSVFYSESLSVREREREKVLNSSLNIIVTAHFYNIQTCFLEWNAVQAMS